MSAPVSLQTFDGTGLSILPSTPRRHPRADLASAINNLDIAVNAALLAVVRLQFAADLNIDTSDSRAIKLVREAYERLETAKELSKAML